VTAAVAYLIAFSSGWKMTLVVTASIPLMVIAGGVQASVMTGFSSQVQYSIPAWTQHSDCIPRHIWFVQFQAEWCHHIIRCEDTGGWTPELA
jgi:hypothetical protein